MNFSISLIDLQTGFTVCGKNEPKKLKAKVSDFMLYLIWNKFVDWNEF